MRAHLIEIESRTDAGLSTVRLASFDDRRLCAVGGVAWYPAIARLPQRRYDFFGGDFRGSVTAPQAAFSIAVDPIDNFGELRFAGARVRYWKGTLGDPFQNFQLSFEGKVPSEPSVDNGIASFSAMVDDGWLDAPILRTFAGTGGIEGTDDLEGAIKPRLFGNCKFAPGVLIDPVDLVYFVNDGPVSGIQRAFDKAISLGVSRGDHPTIEALKAASLPNGSWATCNALGLARLAAPADGKVCFDVAGDAGSPRGFVRLPGAILGRIAEIAGGTPSEANLSALDMSRPYPLTVSLSSQVTARQVLAELSDSVAAVAGVTWTGQFFVQPVEFGDPRVQLRAGFAPPVASVSTQPVSAPYWRLATNSEITWLVHEPSEVGTEFAYRGDWSATRIYRLDDMVDLPDGSAWVYINTVASSGHPPPVGTDGDVWWKNVLRATHAGDIKYGDGSTLEDMKPADPGATYGAPGESPVGNVTGDDIVAAIAEAQEAIDGINELTEEIIASATSLREDVRQIEIGGNLLADSTFVDGLADWGLVTSAPEQHAWGLDNADFELPGEHYQGLLCTAPDEALDAAVVSEWVYIDHRSWVQISAWLASRECRSRIRLQWADEERNYIGDGAESDEVYHPHRGGPDPADFQRVWCIARIPDTARFARFVWVKGPYLDNELEDPSASFLLRPMLAVASNDQTEPSPYLVGGGAYARANARIEHIETIAIGADTAAAQLRQILQVGTGGVSARLQTVEEVAADASARTAGALYQQTLSVSGGIAEMAMYALLEDGTVTTGIKFVGDTFSFVGDVIIDGSLKPRKIDASLFAREGTSVWTGSMTPGVGQNLTVPFSLTLNPIQPQGRFFYELYVGLATNANTQQVSAHMGSQLYTNFVDDGGLFLRSYDDQGNVYRPKHGGSEGVRATTVFGTTFVANLIRGNLDTGIIADGDYYYRNVSATYTLTKLDLHVTWIAV